jgi:hypothetical protein
MNFERVLQKVLWRLVTEGSISYRRIKLSFGLDDDGLEELRRELIGHQAAGGSMSTASFSSGYPMGARPDPSPRRCRNHCRPCGTLKSRPPLRPSTICRSLRRFRPRLSRRPRSPQRRMRSAGSI